MTYQLLKHILTTSASILIFSVSAWAGLGQDSNDIEPVYAEQGGTIPSEIDETTMPQNMKSLVVSKEPLGGKAGLIGSDQTFYTLNPLEAFEDDATNAAISFSAQDPFDNKSTFEIGESSAAKASWYGPGFNGRKTCTGEIFNQNAMTLAAHKWKGQRVCVKNNNNGKRITAKVNDCGPYERRGKRWVPHSVRSFDLSKGLMGALNGSGIIDVTVTPGPC